MSADARSRLAAHAAAAGYPTSLLPLIADATLPTRQAGSSVDDAQLEPLASAIDVLAEAGIDAGTLPRQLADYQQRHGAGWRERFWQETLSIASHRDSTTGITAGNGRVAVEGDARRPDPRVTEPTVISAATAPPTHGTPTAAVLASRIDVPRQLPIRADGQRLTHLSSSSYNLWVACPDSWRRRYLLQEKEPPSGAMFLGSRVDEALSHYYRHWLEHGERLPLGEVKRFFGRNWKEQLEAESDRRGVTWTEPLARTTALKLGVKALTLAFERLVPELGEPVAVQRRVCFRLAPELEWDVEGYLDLETRHPEPAGGEQVEEVIDYKVKAGSALTQATAARSPQAGIYLAARWLERRPADRLRFAQILIPGGRRKTMDISPVPVTRTIGELRSMLARIALAAGQIAAAYEAWGPERPCPRASTTSGYSSTAGRGGASRSRCQSRLSVRISLTSFKWAARSPRPASTRLTGTDEFFPHCSHPSAAIQSARHIRN
jgi:hypothetical protein